MSTAARFDRRHPETPRLFSALVACYSRGFRSRFGNELADVVAELWADSRDKPTLARIGLAVRLAVDLTLGMIGDRLGSLLPRGGPGHGIRRRRPPLPSFIDSALADGRIAVRALGQHRAFALTVILTLGVGIGGVTAMWSVVYDVLLRPLPYANADRLVRVWNDLSWRSIAPTQYFGSSSAQLVAWQDNAKTVEALAAISLASRTVEGADYTSRVPTGVVTANFFDVLGARPSLGRVFRAGEDRKGAGSVAVLSDELWRREFGADPAVVGRSIRVNGTPTEIVGVAAPGFRWVDRVEWKGIDHVELWMARVMDPNDQNHYYQVIARPRPGVTMPNVALDLGSLFPEAAANAVRGVARDNPAARIHIEPVHEALYGNVRDRVLLPLAAVVLVLLLACANTATLLLSRLPARRAELAMRSALGASRARLVRQMLTESLVLASLAAVVGVAIAYWATRAIALLGPREIARIDEVSVSGPALAVSLVTAVLCALVFGLAPAWRGARTDLARDLMHSRARPNGPGRERGRAVLLAAELAVALVLLVGATLTTRSFGRLMGIDAGIDRERTLTVKVNLPAARYQEDLGPVRAGGRAVRFKPEWDRFMVELVQRLERDPRVASASTSNFTPLGGAAGGPFKPDGVDTTRLPTGDDRRARMNRVDGGYFRTLNIPVLQGRGITEEDQLSTRPVAVVNEVLARRFWPGENVLGKRFVWDNPTLDGDSIRYDRVLTEIVGVVGDTREAGYTKAPMPQVYLPFFQRRSEIAPSWAVRGLQFALVVRARSGDAESLVDVVRREVRAIDALVPVSEVRTLEWMVNEEVRSPRFYAFLLSLFGGFALVLAMAGVFGVLAFTVSQRTHEIGVRMALGAQPGAVVRLVVRQVAVYSVLGIACGIGISVVTRRFMQTLLVDVAPSDPMSLSAAIALLMAAACVAAWVPARRAARVDPALALRAE